MEEDEEDYIFYGTPVPDIEDENTLRKKASREQEVRDDKGRQRFHGAFTGGFSAGYFNTVGTKEGWAPSTFVSSRGKTADYIKQNPEDFMDEEDLGEFGIASRKIHTSHKFKDSNSDVKKRKFNELDSVIPGEAPLKELVKLVRDSIGIEILKKLGWRSGQGIGPRTKKSEIGGKVYGCSLPESVSSNDDPYALSYTFAPEDTEAITYKPKDDCFGLGYSGLSKQSVLSARFDQDNPTSTKSFLKKDKKKLAITGQAFGVGAFEDDDEDIYSKDDLTQYDFSEFETSSDKSLSKAGKSKWEKRPDNVLEGFQKASQSSVLKKYYPPPELPSDFIPKFFKLSVQSKSHPKQSHQQSHRTSSVTERSFLLGEKTFQPFELKAPSLPTKEVKNQTNELTNTNHQNSFKPFVNDAIKQRRYEEFLKLKTSEDFSSFSQPSSMTEWEKQQEREEFYRASLLFKPLSGALSSKFESRSHLSVEHEVIDAIEKAKLEKNSKSSSVVKKLVGLKNRQTCDWYPSSLLCKRFNVPNPYPDSTPSEKSSSLQSTSIFGHITQNDSAYLSTNESLSSSQSSLSLEKSSTMPKDPIEKEHDLVHQSQEKVQDSRTDIKKPSMDFFKDIFENSSSEDEDDSDEKVKESSSPVTAVETIQSIPSKTLTQEASKTVSAEKVDPPPKKSGFGVFANLDLDALNQRTFSKKEECVSGDGETLNGKSIEEKNEKVSNVSETDAMEQDDLYGPALPPNFSELPKVDHTEYLSKKHKGKHKHKHHKSKSKKKKKKKSSHKSSDEFIHSSELEEEVTPAAILEKFKKLQKSL